MRFLSAAIVSAAVFASVASAAALPKSDIRGEYVEARNAEVFTGACFANAEAFLVGDLAVFGWRVDKGSFEGVKLDGLGVVGVVKASSTLGNQFGVAYPIKSVLIVDERANDSQRTALKRFAQRMSGDLLQDVVLTEYRPVTLKFEAGNLHSARAVLQAGELAKIETRPLHEDDAICRHEDVWYQPLAELDHAMPAYTVAHAYNGKGLDGTWSSPEKRSAFVGSFHYRN